MYAARDNLKFDTFGLCVYHKMVRWRDNYTNMLNIGCVTNKKFDTLDA